MKLKTRGILNSKVSHSSFHELWDALIAAKSQSISPVASFIRMVASAFCMAVLPSKYEDAKLVTELNIVPSILVLLYVAVTSVATFFI
jgi:hypothetical protein